VNRRRLGDLRIYSRIWNLIRTKFYHGLDSYVILDWQLNGLFRPLISRDVMWCWFNNHICTTYIVVFGNPRPSSYEGTPNCFFKNSSLKHLTGKFFRRHYHLSCPISDPKSRFLQTVLEVLIGDSGYDSIFVPAGNCCQSIRW
jgi:hypothetical protein